MKTNKIKQTIFFISIIIFTMALAMAAFASSVTRSFSTATPAQCSPLVVTLTVDVTAGDTYYALDETYPAGWTVSNPGTLDTTQAGHLKSIVITNAANTQYQYTVNVPCNATGTATFSGTYGFSQGTLPIAGPTSVNVISGCTDMDNDSVFVGGGSCGPVDCNDMNASVYRLTRLYTDADQDTYVAGGLSIQSYCIGLTAPPGFSETLTVQDCNDANAAIHPNANETCNGADDNCNGQIDEGVKNTYYADMDADTYGGAGMSTQACTLPAGYVANNLDCNDNDALINPLANETCDQLDNNCNGQIDEGFQTSTYYQDSDIDTYGNPSVTQISCMPPAGYVTTGTDCDDTNSAIYQLLTGYADNDLDTYTIATSTQVCSGAALPTNYKPTPSILTDCNDNNLAIYPGAAEICNGADDNCNGQIDEGVTTTFYRDFDSDTYGNAANTIQSCAQTAGYVATGTDCDDNNAAIYQSLTGYADMDLDLYTIAASTQVCSGATLPTNYQSAISTPIDCDDTNTAINPGATDICNGIDDNCNAQTDETFLNLGQACTNGIGACQNAGTFVCSNDGLSTTCTANAGLPGIEDTASGTCADTIDNDCDTFTDMADPSCIAGCTDADTDGYSPDGALCGPVDCNDANNQVNPAASEICDGLDNNCDGLIDNGLTAPSGLKQNGVCFGSVQVCTGAGGWVEPDYSLIPSYEAIETLCDNLDNDCNAITDTMTRPTTCGVGACSANTGIETCTLGMFGADTCNPLAGATNETCDAIDNNCNGQIDEGLAQLTFYQDSDSDTFGNMLISQVACIAPQGYVANNTDCNDTNALIYQSLVGYADIDLDTYTLATPAQVCSGAALPTNYKNASSAQTDCNDQNSMINPGSAEICDGLDNNCDGLIDNGLTAPSGLKQNGVCFGSVQVCTGAGGWVEPDYSLIPSYQATETLCDNLDNNCDAAIDNVLVFQDLDNDTFGNPAISNQTCQAGYVKNNTDCNDANPALFQRMDLYIDTDGDGFGTGLAAPLCTNGTMPLSYSFLGGDCNDANQTINPGMPEILGNMIDENCDGNLFIDIDHDNVDDDFDYIMGNCSDMKKNFVCAELKINQSGTIWIDPTNITGLSHVEFEECGNNRTLVEFEYEFGNKSKMNMSSIEIEINLGSAGSTVIKGISIINGTKTVYVSNLNNMTSLCVKDSQISSASEITTKCQAPDETVLLCPGTSANGKYNCTYSDQTNTTFKITGLTHSGIQQQGYCGDSIIQTGEECDAGLSGSATCTAQCTTITPTSSGGGSRSGGSSGGVIVSTPANCTCTEWDQCTPEGTQTRTCNIGSTSCGPQKTENRTCTYTPTTTPTTEDDQTDDDLAGGQTGSQTTQNQTGTGNQLTGQVIGGQKLNINWWITLGVLALIIAVLVIGYFAFRGKGNKGKKYEEGWYQE